MQKFATSATKADVKAALSKMGIIARRNLLNEEIDLKDCLNGDSLSNGTLGSGTNSTLHDLQRYSKQVRVNALAAKIHSQLKGRISYDVVKDSLMVIADENRYNPVQEMLLNTAWDGQDRISVLISDIIGVKTEQEAIYVRKWLHQTVAMAFNGDGVADNANNADNADNAEPSKSYESCEPSELYELYGADGVLVLVGEQGNGKTMLVSKLAVNDDWFIGGRLLSFNKDNVMINTSHWITELCYVDNLSAREKAFLTASSEISRGITKPRLTSFCATLNEMPKVAKKEVAKTAKNAKTAKSEGLSRRLWVVDADNLDLEQVLKLDEDWAKQLWAQVYKELYLPNPQGFRLETTETTETAESSAQ